VWADEAVDAIKNRQRLSREQFGETCRTGLPGCLLVRRHESDF